MKPKENNSVEEFFKGLPTENKQVADVFNDKPKEATIEPATPVDEEADEEPEGRKNRRHRRLEQTIERKDEMIEALTELVKNRPSSAAPTQEPVDQDLIRVFGDTDQGKEIARIMQRKIEDGISTAEQRALERIEQQQVQAAQEQREYEKLIDAQLESIEDEYGVDMTSNSPKARKDRREFLEMVQDLSPKDESGTITGYADFDKTFEIFNSTRGQKDNTRRDEIASRTMQQSAQVSTTKANDDANEAYLRSIGIKLEN